MIIFLLALVLAKWAQVKMAQPKLALVISAQMEKYRKKWNSDVQFSQTPNTNPQPLNPNPKLKSPFPILNPHLKHPTLPLTLILKVCHLYLLCHFYRTPLCI